MAGELTVEEMIPIAEMFDEASDEYTDSFEQRFWYKVDKSSEDDCWEWTACTVGDGYPGIGFRASTRQYMLRGHRVAKFLEKRQDITDYQVNHRCDNRICVNPDHLYLGDQQDNVEDRYKRGSKIVSVSDDEVAEIRRKYKETDMNQYDLAKEYGLDQTTIFSYVNGESRKEVSGPIKGDDY
jgi:DNA-binding XRE family transcriptional regulator